MDLPRAAELRALALDVEAHAADDESGAATARLAACGDEIAPAVELLLAAGEDSAALDLLGALSVYWQDTGQIAAGRELTATTLARAAGGDRADARATARARLVVGELAFRQGDQDGATAATTAALELARRCADTWIEAKAELNLARIAFRAGDAPSIEAHAGRVAALAGDNERLRAGAVHMLGWAAYTAGDLAGAMARFEDNADRYQRLGDRIGAASERANLGDLAAEAGDHKAAAGYLAAAFQEPALRDNRYLGPSLIRSAGVLLAQAGAAVAALRLFAAADRLYEEFGLVADPGDEVPTEVETAARAAAGALADDAARAGQGLSLPQAFDEAASALRDLAASR